MRIAIISDIHSNLEALESVLERLRQEEVDSVLNLGDLVGYNASPAECLALLQSRPDIHNLAGNHDLAVLSPERAEAFNIIAYQALKWCREQLPREDLEFLQGLPSDPGNPGLLGLPRHPHQPGHLHCLSFSGQTGLKGLEQRLRRPGLFLRPYPSPGLVVPGHPGQGGPPGIVRPQVVLSREGHYLINPGSVGQPRDGNPEAAYAIFDDEEFSIHFKSVPYDVAAAQRRILAAGLPPYLAERLALGK